MNKRIILFLATFIFLITSLFLVIPASAINIIKTNNCRTVFITTDLGLEEELNDSRGFKMMVRQDGPSSCGAAVAATVLYNYNITGGTGIREVYNIAKEITAGGVVSDRGMVDLCHRLLGIYNSTLNAIGHGDNIQDPSTASTGLNVNPGPWPPPSNLSIGQARMVLIMWQSAEAGHYIVITEIRNCHTSSLTFGNGSTVNGELCDIRYYDPAFGEMRDGEMFTYTDPVTGEQHQLVKTQEGNWGEVSSGMTFG